MSGSAAATEPAAVNKGASAVTQIAPTINNTIIGINPANPFLFNVTSLSKHRKLSASFFLLFIKIRFVFSQSIT